MPDRLDSKIICGLVEPNSRVLDLGCGDGELLHLLKKQKNVRGQGIDLSDEAIYKCVEKGLSVFHGDIDSGLIEYPDKSFDYVILNQSMQEVRHVAYVIKEALRVGHKVIVGFPNFAYVQARVSLFFSGRTPITKSLPYRWYDTPNIHFLSISDFRGFCNVQKITILKKYYLGRNGTVKILPNLLAVSAIFLITKNDS